MRWHRVGRFLSVSAAIAAAVLLTACREGTWEVGGVYSIASGETGPWYVVKVVSLDPDTGCALVYHLEHARRPGRRTERGLQDGSIPTSDLGEPASFEELDAELIAHEDVTEAEVLWCESDTTEREIAVRAELRSGCPSGDERFGVSFVAGRPSDVPRDFLVTLEREACYGTCPAYSVSIASDGNVLFHGERHVEVTGDSRGSLTEESVKDLLAAACRTRIFDRLSSYVDEGCPGLATDMATVILTVRANGREHRIEHYHGCLGVQGLDELTILEDVVDEIAGTAQWLGTEVGGPFASTRVR